MYTAVKLHSSKPQSNYIHLDCSQIALMLNCSGMGFIYTALELHLTQTAVELRLSAIA